MKYILKEIAESIFVVFIGVTFTALILYGLDREAQINQITISAWVQDNHDIEAVDGYDECITDACLCTDDCLQTEEN